MAYSTELQKNQFNLTCRLFISTKTHTLDFIADTGANFTVIPARELRMPQELEAKFAKSQNYIRLLGLLPSEPTYAYAYVVNHFIVGSVDLGMQVVWVSFDPRMSELLLGMDILQHVNFSYDKLTNLLTIHENNDYLIRSQTVLNLLKRPAGARLRDFLLNILSPSVIEAEHLETEDEKILYAIKQLSRVY